LTDQRYFTDREFGDRPAVVDKIDERVWGGLQALIEIRIGNGAFGYRFPERCPDGHGPCGCDEQAFARVLQAEVPWIEWPLGRDELPKTPVILDLLEFCASAVGEPIEGYFHSYYRHSHLSWDRNAGLAAFVSDVNLLFRRNAVAYFLDASGRAMRTLPGPEAETLGWVMFQTGDVDTDGLLETARSRFMSPKVEDRRDALEKLWDAFERLKTLEPGADKRSQAEALLDRAVDPGTALRERLGEEALALTRIGNTFGIRHSESSQERIPRPEQTDWLFVRMFAFVRLVLRASGRGR
jgi:hypothetical protein